MSNPFAPDFAGASLTTATPGEASSTSATSTSGPLTSKAASTMPPASADIDFSNPSMDPFESHATQSNSLVVDPFVAQPSYQQQQQPGGLATFETSSIKQQQQPGGAYGGATWTSPIALKKQKELQMQQQQQLANEINVSSLMTPAGPPPSQPPPPPPTMQQSSVTGLSGLASPPPLPPRPMGDDSGMGAPMGGASGAGFSTPPPLPSKDTQALTTTSGDNKEEEDIYLQAQRAALEAKAIMEKQAQQQQKKQEGGFLGLGRLVPKQPSGARSDVPPPADATPKKRWFQSNASTTRDASTPPWHAPPQGANQHAATSDFGIPPPASVQQQQVVANVNANHNNNVNTNVNTGVSNNTNQAPGKGAAVMGASVVGGVAGLMLVGPLVGVVAAGGAAYAAGTKEGPVGSILRGTGSLAATAGGVAKRFDSKHQVVGKTLNGVATGVGWVVKAVNNATPDN